MTIDNESYPPDVTFAGLTALNLDSSRTRFSVNAVLR
jgi:hypothetical protein